MTDRISAVCAPGLFKVLPSVCVNAHHIGSVLAEDPELLRPDHKLIGVGKVEYTRETVRNAAVRDGVGQKPLVAQSKTLLIVRFPVRLVRWMFPHTGSDRPALAGLRGAIKNRAAYHRPGTAPIWKLVVRRNRRC